MEGIKIILLFLLLIISFLFIGTWLQDKSEESKLKHKISIQKLMLTFRDSVETPCPHCGMKVRLFIYKDSLTRK